MLVAVPLEFRLIACHSCSLQGSMQVKWADPELQAKKKKAVDESNADNRMVSSPPLPSECQKRLRTNRSCHNGPHHSSMVLFFSEWHRQAQYFGA